MSQSVKRWTLDCSSRFDLSVVSSSSALGSMLGVESTFKNKKRERDREKDNRTFKRD